MVLWQSAMGKFFREVIFILAMFTFQPNDVQMTRIIEL